MDLKVGNNSYDPKDQWSWRDVSWYDGLISKRARLIEAVGTLIEGCAVLEIGGGIGYLSTYCKWYTCIDVNEEACTVGAMRYPPPSAFFICDNLYNVRPSQICHSVDTVVAIAVAEHQPNISKFLKHIGRFKPRQVILTFFQGWTTEPGHKMIIKNNRGHQQLNFNRYKRSAIIDTLKRLKLETVTETHLDGEALIHAT